MKTTPTHDSKQPLKGKVALVTGGSRGIGRACALKLAEKGARVAIGFFKSREKAKKTQAEIAALGGDCQTVRVNLAKTDSVEKMFAEMKAHYGRLDILVCNAAMGIFGLTLDISLEDWELTMDANTRSFFLCAREAVKLMLPHGGGKIVGLTSYGSQRFIPAYAAMGVAKAGIETLTRYLAVELVPKGINVNCVSGGPVDTDSLRLIPGADKVVEESVKRTPAGRIGQPEDIANIVAFLCTDEANWICGQTIVADGGVSLI